MHPTAPDLKRAYAEAPTGQVHYYDGGGGGPAVLLLHQSPTSAIDFGEIFAPLAEVGFRVIAPDMPGMGMSDAPEHPPTIDDFAVAALAVLDAVGVRRAHALGHHTGAQVAVTLAERWPDRIDRLVLYGVPVMSQDEREAFWTMIVPRERDGGAFSPEPGGGHLAALFQRLEGLFGLKVAQRMVISRLLAGPKLWYGHNAALTHDMAPALAADRRPLLLLTHPGEMLDANTRAAHGLRPDARLISLPTACATAMDAAPREFVDAVAGFLREPAN
jgi:pimeloyl-ACP methyl ester carboxylesterase